MWSYVPPLRDFRFVLEELLDAPGEWARIPALADMNLETALQIIEAAGRFAADTLAPLNSAGDSEGCHYADGVVRTPPGFVDAYREFCAAGWPALACDGRFGGQGLPQLLNAALYEMLYSVNHGWTMYPGLAHGAYECLRSHAAPELAERYLPKIVSGEWLCTMCLTEPQAGSDVGLATTRAEPDPDGTYRITGSKIFISGGEHDLTANIVHLVLARLPGAPIGTKGLSLFLVPKFLGENLAAANTLRCDGIERKMGIKGSATCLMRFEGARGWLIGEAHRGLGAMFVMMNSARLYVGLQGLGHAEMAYQNAVRYAQERRQMRLVGNRERADGAASAADPIILQPAVRKLLLTLRAFVEGQRALGMWSAHLLDAAEHHPDAAARAESNDLLSVLTPIIKSLFTAQGFTLSSAAQQVWGGYGYIRDFGVEQTVRDSRVALIYEGTNEIQAVDLLVRKVVGDRGVRLDALLRLAEAEALQCRDSEPCVAFAEVLSPLLRRWRNVTQTLIEEAPTEPALAYGVADDYLRLAGLCLLGFWWARTARRVAAQRPDPFYRVKFETARFFFDHVLPEADLRLALIERRHAPLPWIEPTV
jgi:alkylation response protein AidB-like acyl-CoA dehydrogenase